MLYILPNSDNETYECFEIPAEKLLQIAEKHGRKSQTRPYVNGNFGGFFGVGYILKLQHLRENTTILTTVKTGEIK
ncbi:hypothetical protein [Fluviispira vulneris]|uniref:hypothetical protein n=1 Tax=Fluviispira vulneris TaxID=2763012 RepID=UPI0016468CC9|nr:hypothetical protein [Fluviispira vulneris]